MNEMSPISFFLSLFSPSRSLNVLEESLASVIICEFFHDQDDFAEREENRGVELAPS